MLTRTVGETSCNTLKELLDLLYFRTIKSLLHLLITDLNKSKSIEILNRLRVFLLNFILLSMYVFYVRITLEPNSCIVQSVQYEFSIRFGVEILKQRKVNI